MKVRALLILTCLVPSLVFADAPATKAFAPTVFNSSKPPGPAPEGMAWIPGGEFSMGCEAPSQGVCTMATMNAVNDAQPIHRVYVDGFWMDKTDVTNEQLAKFVKATGYLTVAEIVPTKEQFPTVAGKPDRGIGRLQSTQGGGEPGQLFSMVDLCGRRELASPHRAGQQHQGEGYIRSCRSPTRMRRPTPNGQASAFRPSRNGNSPGGAG